MNKSSFQSSLRYCGGLFQAFIESWWRTVAHIFNFIRCQKLNKISSSRCYSIKPGKVEREFDSNILMFNIKETETNLLKVLTSFPIGLLSSKEKIFSQIWLE